MHHQYNDGNENPEIHIDSASDTEHLQPQTIQWDDSTEQRPRRPSSSTQPRPRPTPSSRPDRSDRSGANTDSDSERDTAFASPTLPPSAMPPSVLADLRSFQDLELPRGALEDKDTCSSSGESDFSIPSDPGTRGEDFERSVRSTQSGKRRRHRRSGLHPRKLTAESATRGFAIPRRPTSDRERRPTTETRRPTSGGGEQMKRQITGDARSRSGTMSSVVLDESDSEVDSKDEEKAEEDVFFPMSDDEEQRDRRGIDFAEMEEFATEMRQLLGSMDHADDVQHLSVPQSPHQNGLLNSGIHRQRSGSRISTMDEKKELTSALHHHPAFKPRSSSSDSSTEDEKATDKFTTARLPKLTRTPTIPGSVKGLRKHGRFTFFNPAMEETLSAEEWCDLVEPGETYAELFDQSKGTWWLDVLNPSVEEMKMLSKAFNIHPLTNEDIRTQESREKVELFRTYYFVCFRSFEGDAEKEDYLEAANMYIVVFRSGLLTFHFTNTPHAANVRRRIRQLRDYVSVSSDWICYALIDDITDAFAPLVNAVEAETEAIEDGVMVARVNETGDMLVRISLLRKKIMGLLKLLGGKADVIKMFAKRCNEHWDVAPTGEIGLYLGDIQGILPFTLFGT